MELDELKMQCANILIDGKIDISEDGMLSFDVSEEEKLLFIEYAVNMILKDALDVLETKVGT
jgi:calcineurin-like phosphoesterase family protein